MSVTSRTTSPRIGIFGGTFDPIHVGHLVAAENARYACQLDKVIFIVAGDPWHKSSRHHITNAEDRLRAVQAAIRDEPTFEASRIEIDRPGATYTADTLMAMQEAQPEADFFLIMGTDSAATLGSWARNEIVAELSTVVIVRRPGNPTIALDQPWKSVQVDMPALEISSTDLRERMRDGRPWRYLVPDSCSDLIQSVWGYDGDVRPS